MTFADLSRGWRPPMMRQLSAMRPSLAHRACILLLAVSFPARAGDKGADVAEQAQAVLKQHCYRCHGQDGSLEGGMSFILDRDRLIARKKVVPGNAQQSPLWKRVA